jgi:hypothetical protein
MDPAKPSLDSNSFSFEKRSRLLVIVALLLQIGALGFVLYVGIRLSTLSANVYTLYTIAAVLFFLQMIIATTRLLRTIDDRVVVDDVGIWYFAAKNGQTVLRWDDIAGVKRPAIIKYLGIVDSTGTVRIKIDKRLKNFDMLERLIKEHIEY